MRENEPNSAGARQQEQQQLSQEGIPGNITFTFRYFNKKTTFYNLFVFTFFIELKSRGLQKIEDTEKYL